MTNEMLKELIKSYVYGMTTAEMAETYELTENEIEDILASNNAEIANEREYRNMLESSSSVSRIVKAPQAASGAYYTGPDLSVHNGYVDMAAVKRVGHSFIIIRDGYGDILSYPGQKDARFEQNYTNAKSAGLSVGTYHYMYATTVAGAKREAQGFLANIKGKKFDMPIALDIEERSQYNLSNSTVEAIVKAFMDVCEAAGYYCALYSYESFLSSKMSSIFRSKYDVWCANISRTPSIPYGIHQYTFTGIISGVSGRVDLNRTTKDYPTIIKNAGKNGFSKDTKKVLDSSGLKYGDSGIAVLAYKQLLIALKQAGIITQGVDNNDKFGEGTKKATNELLAAGNYSQNGIAGENTIKYAGKILKGSV